ncbi:hypothetical protein OEZ86_005972 [Tetradesmus obliquus]|nr:hypothetical protein OEZ86_005972 [Tetradesmus obliquus]
MSLQLDRTAIDTCSRASGLGVWGLLTSRFSDIFGHTTITATAAAAILGSMPRTLSTVSLKLQGSEAVTAIPLHDQECALIRSGLAALPHLQHISIAGPGIAACLPCSPNLATTFNQLTSLHLGTIRSHAEVVQLLAALPAGLVQLRLDVDTPDPRTKAHSSDVHEQMMQLQRGVQLAHLTTLQRLRVIGACFLIGPDSTLPPNVIQLIAPCLFDERPLLPLTNLQHLDIDNLNALSEIRPEGFARTASLKQLKFMFTGALIIEHEDAVEMVAGLAALSAGRLPLRDLHVVSQGPQQPGAAGGVFGPAALGRLLGQLTGLRSLVIQAGTFAWTDVAASLVQLTCLQELIVASTVDDSPALIGDVADCETFVDAIVGCSSCVT